MGIPEMTEELWTACVDLGFTSNGATLSPDDISGASIANADTSWPPKPADLHDCRYFMGGTEVNREEADVEFREGLYACVDEVVPEGLARDAARRRCRVYFEAVREVGGKFWNHKPAPAVA